MYQGVIYFCILMILLETGVNLMFVARSVRGQTLCLLQKAAVGVRNDGNGL